MSAPQADPFALDAGSVSRAFDRASADYDAAAALQARVREELLGRLEPFQLEPLVVLDLGAGTGHACRELVRRYRKARVVALDIAPGMLRQARRRSGLFRRFVCLCADARRLPLRDASVGLVFSSLMLQWCDDLAAVLAEVRRVLAPDGFFGFASFGPDTLHELRAAWAAVDDGAHVHRFLDVHDVGDALTRAGFSEPVLDVERIELEYPDVGALTHDLKAIGAHNAMASRRRGLTGKGRWRAMTAAYEPFRRRGALPASYEVVYGAAWGSLGASHAAHAAHAPGLARGEAVITPDAIRRPGSRR
ncbi:MAG TPA: malonyl-ACP O-methyltransferase BioC [Steroidobacteraceae bacterium]|nr:malonyl-ACP O-methyltransferase BioC [Steroidobacteraceae bacterium]